HTGSGGALFFNDMYDDIVIFAAHFAGNKAGTAGGAIALMGTGQARIDGGPGAGHYTKMVSNTANGVNANMGGGGLFINRGGSATTIVNTEIRGNTAKGATGGGGVLYTGESAAYFYDNVVIAGNTAGDAYGGGIYNLSQNGRLYLAGDVTVGGDTPADANFAGKGGGVAVKGTNTANEQNFAGLKVDIGSGKKPKITGNGTITEGGAEKITSVGGGIYADGHILLEIAGEISHNKAVNGGGGIFVELNAAGRTTIPENFPAVTLFDGALIKGNEVTEQNITGAAYNNGGGGIHIRRSDATNNSYLLFTMAENDTDAVEISDNTAVQGAGIYLHNLIFDGAAPSAASTAGFVMRGGTIKNNTASSTDSGTTAVLGGGVCLAGSNSSANTQKTGFYMAGGSIQNNAALGSDAAGGGVFLGNSHVKFTFAGGTISTNEAGLHGGGVSVGRTAERAQIAGIKFLIDGGSLENNTAGNYGGAVFMNSDVGGAVEFTAGSFSNNRYTNTAGQEDGHTLFVSTGKMTIGSGHSAAMVLEPSTVSGYHVIDGDSDAYVYPAAP
ncbi:MAG: hypothetical protein LBD20_09640, partial [Spirochaetaceae bacterium]|nr:hypothetical protein [Spirochaetaceae bacterium]